MRYARDQHEADDMAQEAWMLAFSKLDRYAATGEFGAWLRTLTVNSCLQVLRKRKLQVDESVSERLAGGDQPLPDNMRLDPTAISTMSADELVAHIQQLPEGFRMVFNLVAIEGYSHAEAAAALGIEVSTSRSQLTRARAQLQQRLKSLLAVCL